MIDPFANEDEDGTDNEQLNNTEDPEIIEEDD